uniref:Photosystem I assembly protein Ycf4 n=1 Tax=Adenocalymma allamandiflorum TaxID=2056444 RepID=A0A2H4RE76_9LAMI|nr:photosystem I assembly protein ycf4 [Adenocalymma allamandiflorum]ATY47834.1 photosystem I assembly protein ycf4 [Adenocalymma allamandiflorum]
MNHRKIIRYSLSLWFKFTTMVRKLIKFSFILATFLGSQGLLSIGMSSYLCSYFYAEVKSFIANRPIPFHTQGVMLFFSGIWGIFVSVFLWSRFSWTTRSYSKKGFCCILRWGFPEPEQMILFQFCITEIKSVKSGVKRGPKGPCKEIRGEGNLLWSRVDKNLTPQEDEHKIEGVSFSIQIPMKGR